ncbi:MAG: hypothetical protein J6V92_00630 [Bacteroidaceae bacterium]|nr:hypothetical protein [Bacteroidaceae bacterium]
MNTTRITMALFFMLCLCINVQAQFDDEYNIEEWTLDLEEEEAPKPKHKEYKNAIYLQYSPSRYKVSDDNRIRFNEFLLGYNRSIQVVEDLPYFVEAGANIKFSWAKSDLNARLITFRIPVNVLYKIYLSKEKDYAIAPFAGASCRVIAMAREYSESKSICLFSDAGWERFQVAWQAGVRFYMNRYFLGISYLRDFRDSSKYPGMRECGIHFGCCF